MSDPTSRPGLGVVALDPPSRGREIKDVETLRVVADPIRIAILRVLMTDSEFDPPVMSAKELAVALGEPQTKLYRHLKQLEEADLIQVAETRLVSGILEQRYRTAQMSIGMSSELVANPDFRDETLSLTAAAFNDFRDELLTNAAAGRVRIDASASVLHSSNARIPSERAGEFHKRFSDLIDEFNKAGDPDGIKVHLFVAMYSQPEA